ncbi:MAG: hypothetical protein B9S33_15005 [Pedosphaera sp. Tous-C6FEB]|nr:MAG: hypothetical protein B9S33_15005 [Pedosphaera sp. Tous-C6FEB]
MKRLAKKIQKNFRLETALAAELERCSGITGIPETRIVEDALRFYFAGPVSQQLSEMAKELRKPDRPT